MKLLAWAVGLAVAAALLRVLVALIVEPLPPLPDPPDEGRPFDCGCRLFRE